MVKFILSLSVFVFSTSMLAASVSLAGECVDSKGKDITSKPDVFQAEIAKKQSCFEAKSLAEACAWGSGLDVSTAGVANQICSKELKNAKASKSLMSLLSEMNKACSTKYDKMDGTMYRSASAYCYLSAVDFINNLAQQE